MNAIAQEECSEVRDDSCQVRDQLGYLEKEIARYEEICQMMSRDLEGILAGAYPTTDKDANEVKRDELVPLAERILAMKRSLSVINDDMNDLNSRIRL